MLAARHYFSPVMPVHYPVDLSTPYCMAYSLFVAGLNLRYIYDLSFSGFLMEFFQYLCFLFHRDISPVPSIVVPGYCLYPAF